MAPADLVERTRAVLGSAHRRAAAHWPGVTLEEDRFAQHLAARLPDPPEAALASLHLGDLYLACACLDGIPAALEAFDRAFAPVMRQALARLHLSDADVDDCLQTLRLHFFVQRKIDGYSGRGPLAGWARSAATRTGIDLIDARKPRPDDSDEILAALPSTGNIELDLMRGRFAREFKAAFTAAIAALSPEDRTLLAQHYIDGLTIDRLAAVLGIHRSTAARRVEHVRDALFASTRERLQSTLEMDAALLESFMRLMSSDMNVSIFRLLRG